MVNKYTANALAGVAVCALVAIPVTVGAQEVEDDNNVAGLFVEKSYSEDVDVTATNDTSVSLNKDISVSKDIDITGSIVIKGELIANESAMSTVDNKQIVNDNVVSVLSSEDNGVTLGGNSLENASGRIGLNASAGDMNLQDNATVLSAIGSVTTGASDAEVFAIQKGFLNSADFGGEGVGVSTENSGVLLGAVLQGASGDIGVNVAAGAFNGQKNSLSVASVTGTAVLAEASAAILQESTFNGTSYGATNNTASLGDNALSNASGNVGVNVAAGANNLQANSLSISSVQ